MTAARTGGGAAQRGPVVRAAAAVGAVLVVLTFLALGTWQVMRLQWKRDLIARVDSRIHMPPAPAPLLGVPVSREADEYKHVRLEGSFLDERSAYVMAVTDLGSGFWVVTPLCRPDGSVVLVNRGFVVTAPPRKPHAAESPAACAPGTAGAQSSVTGLLRISEPGGAFLRQNNPTQDRWYSRDVEAIAAARGLPRVVPYFVDADLDPSVPRAPGVPVGGLTVVHFNNNHLSYALTWYAMALLSAGAFVWMARNGRRRDQLND
ncbi:SURF1 family protein [Massilia arenosa]|uniref:SURF1-like protein n=1 Tax=Zemynaea arenosa TaxID=2561931 RepID=A0A4Y9SHB6_9BURK|nr:SURF1 family protein [Massilia arenosa]TFW20823.1 SURF1 family protein [Massilia arenosa]